MSNFHFKTMAFFFKFRDFLFPRKNILKEVKIEPGFLVLDYGCGPGSYSVVAAELVGTKGKVYALDIQPAAVESVQKFASKKGFTNIETILSNQKTGLKDNSLDIVLLYDVLHELEEPNVVLKEINRVLKPEGILSIRDHHLKEEKLISEITGSGLFRLSNKGKKTYGFSKKA